MTTTELSQETDRVIRSSTRHALVSQWLFEHAELLASYSWEIKDKNYVRYYTCEYSISLICTGPDQKDTMSTLRRSIGGKWTKQVYGESFVIERKYGPEAVAITIRIQGERESVCRKVVTGTQEKVIPAVEAQPERTETVEIIEWDCGSLLDD